MAVIYPKMYEIGKNKTPARKVRLAPNGKGMVVSLAGPIRLEHSNTQTYAAITKS